MSLEYAILGLLDVVPMTGYDLKTRYFDKTVAYFWPADKAQIYRTLDKMAEAGWVAVRLEIQTERPNRKVYSITPLGQTELQAWLSAYHPSPVSREPFLVQLFFADQLPNETLFRLIETQIEVHQAILQSYNQIDLPPLSALNGSRELSLRRLTLELGIATEQTVLEWLKQTRQVIEELGALTKNETEAKNMATSD
ncbi:MAG: PadR family transcriptional regulator [Chloroflexota bacterium]|nr:PadR family transcriptional regulator [Chloroflexota bacterium]